jgi:hypothetical protein
MLHYAYAKCLWESNWTKMTNGCAGGKALCFVLQTDINYLVWSDILPRVFYSQPAFKSLWIVVTRIEGFHSARKCHEAMLAMLCLFD